MKMSKLFIQTLREFPSDAEVISHKMLIRAGYIRKLSSGIYSYLPLMRRVLKKIETIVREEMDAAGAQELLMPFVQPRELWEESGRWEVYGKELMRLKDRHNHEMCLGPTHEEVITAVARDSIKSYKQMPVNLYQIQSKFRDEVRPRYGLLRGREFIMKDAYSFDVDQAGLDREYQNMAKTYTKIFERCGLETKMVQSDSGAIGGSVSHEFMVITDQDSGENDVFYCNSCDYAANSNHAVSKLPEVNTDGGFIETKIVDTPNTKTIEELARFLNIQPSVILKTLVYIADKEPVLVLIRADKSIEETKLMNALGVNEIRIASAEEIKELMRKHGFDAEPGFIGPITGVRTIADETVRGLKNFVAGINQTDKHMTGASLPEINHYADLRLVQAGELCPQCGKPLPITGGIEVGNIFKLGTKYSKSMNAVFLDENSQSKPYVMGCYGIGISRTAAAAVEACHDENGIKWPLAIAPYHAVIVPVNIQDAVQTEIAEKLYKELQDAGVEAVLDDRVERAGVKFKDADLIGFPFRITAGKTAADGLVELKTRSTGEVETVTPEEASSRIIKNCKRQGT
ncbi:MAG: proline--tRNA ligase [Heliobacteriaceae bacterium]|jgi:prolyl-tRNA synthetase|nr:proline--tRNA ligase [Heliobacteriaceae bacterium]